MQLSDVMLPVAYSISQQVNQPGCCYYSSTSIEFRRLLAPHAPRQTYRRRQGEVKTVIHWGQRKLLLAEIEFLTRFSEPGACVVYAGAAPGTHTQYLIDLFPHLSFVLVDPSPFSTQLQVQARCSVRQEAFTDAIAAEFAGRGNILFISDIRSCDPNVSSPTTVERQVLQDMLAQQRWHDIIRPLKSMLKFRLPWAPGQTEYLAGDVYLQAFGPVTSTETRLVPHGHGRVQWDNRKYEEQLFHFNTVTRVSRYPHPMPVGRHGHALDYCYDCRAEVEILTQYLRKYRPELRGLLLTAACRDMTFECGKQCDANRSLLDGNLDPEDRRHNMQVFKRRRTARDTGLPDTAHTK